MPEDGPAALVEPAAVHPLALHSGRREVILDPTLPRLHGHKKLDDVSAQG